MAGPTVIMDALTPAPILDNAGAALTPIDWIVEGVPAGDDPMKVPGVPMRGSPITMFGTVFTCDRLDTPTRIRADAYRIRSYFSTDGRWEVLTPPRRGEDVRNFELGYRKVKIEAPSFIKTTETRTEPGGEVTHKVWKRQDIPRTLEWRTLSIDVTIEVANDQQILAAITATELQEGHIHRFPYNPNKLWLMLTCGIKRRGDKMDIRYTWESDPGNGPMEIPDLTGVLFTDKIQPPARSPFHVYTVMPPEAGDADKKPRIWTANLFPQTNNPFYTPNGYVGLPGNPI